MKLFFITLSFMFLLLSVSINAQLINSYKAKDGIEDARKWLKNNGMQDPRLVIMATTSSEIDFAGTKIKIQFDFENGKSQAWVYLFRDEKDTVNIKGVVVTKSLLGATVLEIPYKNFMPEGLKVNLDISLEQFSYFDSDISSQKFKENSDFADYYNKSKPQEEITMALFASEDFGVTQIPQPYWGVIMVKNGTQKMCAEHAVSGDIFCSPDIINGVNENFNSDNMKSYPNPAEEYLNIDNIPSSDKYEVYDTFGRKVDVKYSLGPNTLRLNIGGLTSGVYYLRTSGNSILFIRN